jgi:hypothetical protein
LYRTLEPGIAYVGAGSTITTMSGFPVPSGGFLKFRLQSGNAGSTLRAVTVAGTATLGFIVSDSYGLGPNAGVQ